MPRGFDTPSGAELPNRLKEIAGTFLRGLQRGRAENRITPEQPITAGAIVTRWPAIRSTVDVRALVNYWRREGEPIASSGHGYFYARTWDELEPTVSQLEDRMAAIQAARDGLLNGMRQKQGQLFQD